MREWKCRSYRSGMRACSYFELKRCGVSSLQLKILLDTQTHTTAPIVQQNRSDCIGAQSVKSRFSFSLSPFCSHRINLFYVARRQAQRKGGEEEERGERLRRRTCGRGIIMPAFFLSNLLVGNWLASTGEHTCRIPWCIRTTHIRSRRERSWRKNRLCVCLQPDVTSAYLFDYLSRRFSSLTVSFFFLFEIR